MSEPIPGVDEYLDWLHKTLRENYARNMAKYLGHCPNDPDDCECVVHDDGQR